jgi:hypothetical protein
VKPYSVIDSSRTCSEVCSSTGSPAAGSGPGGDVDEVADPTDVDDDAAAVAVGDATSQVGDHGDLQGVPRAAPDGGWRPGGDDPRSASNGFPAAAAGARGGQVGLGQGVGRRGARDRVGQPRTGEVGQRDRERVGDVGGRGNLVEPELGSDEPADGSLVGVARAGDGLLDLVRAVGHDREPDPRRGEQRHARRLPGRHRRADVGREQHPFDRDRVGPVGLDHRDDGVVDGEQPLLERRVAVGADAVEVQQPRTRGRAGHDPEPAAGQAGVDPQHHRRVTGLLEGRERRSERAFAP